jgi:hypothetical protein
MGPKENKIEKGQNVAQAPFGPPCKSCFYKRVIGMLLSVETLW